MKVLNYERKPGAALISGYVNTTEKLSSRPTQQKNGKPVFEVIEPGAWRDALRRRGSMPVLLDIDHEHGAAYPCAQLVEDGIGLFLALQTSNRDLIRAAKRARGWSFEMADAKSYVKEDSRLGVLIRHIFGLDLLRVSLCVNLTPVYAATSVEVSAA